MTRRDYSHLKALQVHEDYDDCPPACPYCHIEELEQRVEALTEQNSTLFQMLVAEGWEADHLRAALQQGGEE